LRLIASGQLLRKMAPLCGAIFLGSRALVCERSKDDDKARTNPADDAGERVPERRPGTVHPARPAATTWRSMPTCGLITFGPRARCARCGELGGTAIANWNERADYLPGGARYLARGPYESVKSERWPQGAELRVLMAAAAGSFELTVRGVRIPIR